MYGLICLDGTVQGLEMLQLKSWRRFPWLGAFPEPFGPACVCWDRVWDEYSEQVKGNKGREVWSGDAVVLASKALGGGEGSPARCSSPWKTHIDQVPVTFGLVVLLQCLWSDGKLTNNKSKRCFQTVQKIKNFEASLLQIFKIQRAFFVLGLEMLMTLTNCQHHQLLWLIPYHFPQWAMLIKIDCAAVLAQQQVPLLFFV